MAAVRRKFVALLVVVVIAAIGVYIWQRPSKPISSASTTTKTTKTVAWKTHTIEGQKLHFSYPSNWIVTDQNSVAPGPPHRTVTISSADHIVVITIGDGFTGSENPAAPQILKTEPITLLGQRYFLAYCLGSTERGQPQVFAKVITDPNDVNSWPPSPDVPSVVNGVQYSQPLLDAHFFSNHIGSTVESLTSLPSAATAKQIIESFSL